MQDDPNLYIGPPDPLRDHPRYSSLRLLSQGSCGVVLLAYDTTDRDYVAVKLIERSAEKLTKNVEREIINHSLLSHPHVIRFRECFLTTKHLAIVMEYLIVALDYCHKMSICSRDVKLENTLIDNPADPSKAIIKLCDFGYSINEAHSLPQSAVGTPGYTAPEILTSRCRYDAKLADVWSCGVMLYIMLFCAYPFERPEDARLGPKRQAQANAQRILAADYQLPASKPISRGCCDLLARILVPGPLDRITVGEIQKHPWFREDLPVGIEGVNSQYLGDVEQANAQALTVRTILRGALQAATCPPPIVPGPSRPFPMPASSARQLPPPGKAIPKPHPRTISSISGPTQSSSKTSTAAPTCPACRTGLVPEPSPSHSHSTVPCMSPRHAACSLCLVPEPPLSHRQHPCMNPHPAEGSSCSPHLVAEPSMHQSHSQTTRTGSTSPAAGTLSCSLVSERQRPVALCQQGHFQNLGQQQLGQQGLSGAAWGPNLSKQPHSRLCHYPISSNARMPHHTLDAPLHAASPSSSHSRPFEGLNVPFLCMSQGPVEATSSMADASHVSLSHPGSRSLPGLTTTSRGSVRQKRNASLPKSTGSFQLPIDIAAPESSRPLLDLSPDFLLGLDVALNGLAPQEAMPPGLQGLSSQNLQHASADDAATAAGRQYAAQVPMGRQNAPVWAAPHPSRCASAGVLPENHQLSMPGGGPRQHQLMRPVGVGSKRLQPDRMPASGDWSTSPAGMQQRHSPDTGHLVCRAMRFPPGP
ncbi:hypothetical protein WJX74_006958 [Apatococcus lobatus]|uniref:Protein kinase domain-containing protein n=1 Tax=Apatococcus lobatus TaxID=904363 RepID=A0AAW1S5I5_9CHLO